MIARSVVADDLQKRGCCYPLQMVDSNGWLYACDQVAVHACNVVIMRIYYDGKVGSWWLID